MSEQDDSSNTNTNTNTNTKKKNSDDLLSVNETESNEQLEQIFPKEGNQDQQQQQDQQPEFDINQYTGFPMEQWVKYAGTINDNRQRRRVSIAGLDKYRLRYNASNDDDLPEWEVTELQYYPTTVKAWHKRQSDLADIDDRNREIGAIDLQLSEIQNSLRARTMNSGKQDEKSLSSRSLEEMQDSNISYLKNLNKNMKREFQQLKNNADKYAFKIYFHKDDSLFYKIRSDDLDDVIGACDWKQQNGPANLRPSKNLPMQVQPGVK